MKTFQYQYSFLFEEIVNAMQKNTNMEFADFHFMCKIADGKKLDHQNMLYNKNISSSVYSRITTELLHTIHMLTSSMCLIVVRNTSNLYGQWKSLLMDRFHLMV